MCYSKARGQRSDLLKPQAVKILMLSHFDHLAGGLGVDSKVSEVTLLPPRSHLRHADWSVTRIMRLMLGGRSIRFSALHSLQPSTCRAQPLTGA